MATAFTAEAIIAAVVVIVPMLSTGVIPMSARVPIYTPVKPVIMESAKPPEEEGPRATGPTRSTPTSRTVVSFGNNKPLLSWGPPQDVPDVPVPPGPPGPKNAPNLISDNRTAANVKPAHGPVSISHLSEAQLINRVEPLYPHIAAISGIQGQVKLHAIIARDGSIQSLNAISGHPLLVRAALDAVEQWRYRPYVLNGEAVEVETFITVNFRKGSR
jgi:protein TonB